MIERWSLKERVKEQIEYDALCTQYAVEDVDALVELIAEMQSSTAAAIRLGKDQIPIEIIKERFRRKSWILESGMLTGFLSCFVGSRAFSSAMCYLQMIFYIKKYVSP